MQDVETAFVFCLQLRVYVHNDGSMSDAAVGVGVGFKGLIQALRFQDDVSSGEIAQYSSHTVH